MVETMYPDLGQKYFLSVSCPKCNKHIKDFDITESIKGDGIKDLVVKCCLCEFEIRQHPPTSQSGLFFDVDTGRGNSVIQIKELGIRTVPKTVFQCGNFIPISFRKKSDPIQELKNDLWIESRERREGLLNLQLFFCCSIPFFHRSLCYLIRKR